VVATVDEPLRPVVALFGEAQGRIVISCDPASTAEVLRLAGLQDVPARTIGRVTDAAHGFRLQVRDGVVQATLDELMDAYFGALPRIMDASPASGA
jgi:phosphoribosylformylglycinamidine synthase